MMFLLSQKMKRLGAALWMLMVVGMMFVSIDPQPFLQFGWWGILGFNLLGPGTVLIPILAPRMNLLELSLVSAVGMAINDSLSWLVGKDGEVILPEKVKTWRLMDLIRKAHPVRTFFAMLGLAILPIPLDVVGLFAGYIGLKFWPYLVASVLGKFIRFMLIGGFVLWLDIDVVEWVRWFVGA